MPEVSGTVLQWLGCVHRRHVDVGSRSSDQLLPLPVPWLQVERLDDPSLRGAPVAVRQFNAGGFVAVSYEARAAGVKCGDGVGAGGRASLPHLQV